MITRIEVDGCKSFVDLALDLPPFLAVIGRNASGKSNLLDALAFVAAVGRGDGLADTVASARGDARSLLHRRADGTAVDRMRFALEFEPPWQDPDVAAEESPGRPPAAWRYEAELRLVPRADRRVLRVVEERFFPVGFPDLPDGHAYLLPAAARLGRGGLRGRDDFRTHDREARPSGRGIGPFGRVPGALCAEELDSLVLLDAVPREEIVFLESATRVAGGQAAGTVTRPRRLAVPGAAMARDPAAAPPVSEAGPARFRSTAESVA